MNHKPMFLDDAKGRKLFAVYYPPSGAVRRREAVILCNPGLEEYMRCHWPFRQLSTLLSEQGFPVLRLDYCGTGDSSGANGSGSLDEWAENIVTGAKFLEEEAATPWISLIGIRLGAAVALKAMQKELPVYNLILWDPVLDGKVYLDEIQSMKKAFQHELSLIGTLLQRIRLRDDETTGFPMSNAWRQDLSEWKAKAMEQKAAKGQYIVSDGSEENRIKDFLSEQSSQGNSFVHHSLDEKAGWADFHATQQVLFARQAISRIVDIMKGKAHV